MGTNTNLTRDKAAELLKGYDVLCPKCGEAKLIERRTKKVQKELQHKARNCEYICPLCEELYRPVRLI